jgi:hypothetical protein
MKHRGDTRGFFYSRRTHYTMNVYERGCSKLQKSCTKSSSKTCCNNELCNSGFKNYKILKFNFIFLTLFVSCLNNN